MTRQSAYICRIVLFGITLLGAGVRAEDLTLLKQIQTRHQQVHEQVAPAVVAVQCRGSRSGSGFYGTGVVVSPDGLVLTSSTVVPASSKAVQVFFPDGRVMDAKVLGTDPATEACVLQVVKSAGEAKKAFQFVELSDSSKASVGDLAYTAGNPFHTISRDGQVAWSIGTISGMYKINSADEQSRYSGLVLETDAAVNPGSDGGPLIDANGRLLGLLSLCFCESRWLGTAIPAHLIKQSLATHLQHVPLIDPYTPGKPGDGDAAANVISARAIPEGLRAVSRPVHQTIVKVHVKRPTDNNTAASADHRGSLVRRLRQRPDGPATGVIIDAEGYVVTSAFNVEGENTGIEIQLGDDTMIPATLLGRHLGLDIAILQFTPPKGRLLPATQLCEAPALRIGQYVAVLGASEEGAVPTRTLGIVSALGRLDGTAVQTDALINYGNSGGPVIDLRGRLVGIAAQVRTHTDWSQQNSGVGFFTQSDKIIACLADLKAGRDIKAAPRAFLGVSSADASPDLHGVRLDEVVKDSPAAKAKLEPGDVILAVDGMDTHSWPALVRVLKAHKPGDSVEITFQRGSITGRAAALLTGRKDVQ